MIEAWILFDLAHAAGAARDLAAGFAHPFTGWDHLLAMLAAGMWASQGARSARIGVPLAFLGAMIAGAIFAASGIPIPMVESGILASVFVLGLLLASALHVSVLTSIAIAAVFAVLHGHAHASEQPPDTAILPYAFGFMSGSIALLAAGSLVVVAAPTQNRQFVLRSFGATTALVALISAVTRW